MARATKTKNGTAANVGYEAELWRMATEWQVRPTRVLTGHLWELA